jgi:acyl-CoA thioesterase-1
VTNDDVLQLFAAQATSVLKSLMSCVAVLASIAITPVSAKETTSDQAQCRDAPVRPATVTAYFRSLLQTGAPRVAPPASDMQAYQAASRTAKANDWANLCQYRADNLRVAALPQRERRVVYMGDSITEGWGLSDRNFFSNGRVNRGISGQTTGQMLLRFESDVVALHPKIVHILAGTNDLAGNEGPETLDDIRNNLIAMVTLARANGIRVVLASITPARRFPWKPAVEPAPKIRVMNAWLKSYAERIGATYVDYYTLLVDGDGGMRADLTFDGVHLNGAGYALIKRRSSLATIDHRKS